MKVEVNWRCQHGPRCLSTAGKLIQTKWGQLHSSVTWAQDRLAGLAGFASAMSIVSSLSGLPLGDDSETYEIYRSRVQLYTSSNTLSLSQEFNFAILIRAIRSVLYHDVDSVAKCSSIRRCANENTMRLKQNQKPPEPQKPDARAVPPLTKHRTYLHKFTCTRVKQIIISLGINMKLRSVNKTTTVPETRNQLSCVRQQLAAEKIIHAAETILKMSE